MAPSAYAPLAIAGGLGAMIARLVTGPWPAELGDWIGVLLLGVLVAGGCFLILRIWKPKR